MRDRQAAARALSDTALVLAMRNEDVYAWGEFVARAQPILRAAARPVRYDRGDSAPCVDDLLTRVAAHLALPTTRIPTVLAPYLINAATRCRREFARNLARQHATRTQAVLQDTGLGLPDGDGIVGSLVSGYTRSAAAGYAADTTVSETASTELETVLEKIVRHVELELSVADNQLLTWHSQGVPHRDIAHWLQISYAATAKRIQRLLPRVRSRIEALMAALPFDERTLLEARYLARADSEDVRDSLPTDVRFPNSPA